MTLRRYSDLLTAEVNAKGVLDVDTVKGCTAGMRARPGTGCYGACYAATIAKFRGIDFSTSVVRTVQSKSQASQIESAVRHSPYGFFRIGTMGDPCHAWDETVETVKWLAPYAVPVIITKHWHRMTDEQLRSMVDCGAILNTSLSALDTQSELLRREHEFKRYADSGGLSVARIVSCEFNEDDPVGERMARIQRRLMTLSPIIDNPLRASRTHPMVKAGIVKLTVARDLIALRTISISNADTYTGHCNACPDQCGLSSRANDHPRPSSPQYNLL